MGSGPVGSRIAGNRTLVSPGDIFVSPEREYHTSRVKDQSEVMGEEYHMKDTENEKRSIYQIREAQDGGVLNLKQVTRRRHELLFL